MSLGQSGPPATPKQVQYLKALLEKAGYATWRDARRPLGLTQRQGSGKFTRREASELIDRLLATDDGEGADGNGTSRHDTSRNDTTSTVDASAVTHDTSDTPDPRLDLVRGFPADLLADELRRRGWTATPPA